MREFAVILFVIMILLALTAVRYRKQISMLIGVGRMIREAKAGIADAGVNRTISNEKSTNLVNCSKCGVWVPADRAIRVDGKTYICLSDCSKTKTKPA